MERLNRVTSHLTNGASDAEAKISKVGILTSGGIAPCLSSAVGGLIERYSEIDPSVQILCYRYGYQGLLTGDSFLVTPAMRKKAHLLHNYGGSPLGNSRVKMTNVKDCLKRGLIKEGQDPQDVAAKQLVSDGITILHAIGGDDTNTTAARLSFYLKEKGYALTVIGLPKTIDNDVIPVKKSLGAETAAQEGATFFHSIVNETTAGPKMLIVHEVMGRHCGWLSVATALKYRKMVQQEDFLPESMGLITNSQEARDVHAIYIPELKVDFATECKRLKAIMDKLGSVNIFMSEGACAEEIIKEREAAGETVPRDAFGHAKLDNVNAGQWIGEKMKAATGAGKLLVQKSGYRCRSAPANSYDQNLIKSCVDYAVDCAFRGVSGLIGHDEEDNNRLKAIDYHRVDGGKAYDVSEPEFIRLMAEIGQPYYFNPPKVGKAQH